MDTNPSSTFGKVLKTALSFAALVAFGALLFFGVPLVISSIATHGLVASFAPGLVKAGLVSLGKLFAAHAVGLSTIIGGAAVAGGLWRGVEEVANHRLENEEVRAKEIRAERAPSQALERAPEQDYSKAYDTMGITPSGTMAQQEQARRAAIATAAGKAA